MDNVAVHIELTGDLAQVRAAAEKFVKSLPGTVATAFVSTHEGTHDLKEQPHINAETLDGKAVKIKNPAAFLPFPKTIARVTHKSAAGEWQIESEKRGKNGEVVYVPATKAQITAAGGDAE